MASRKNDALLERTVEGSVNYYDGHKGKGTAADKALAARFSGASYNVINNSDHHERYFKELRHDEHFVDRKGRHTAHLFGARRRKFAGDERNHIRDCLTLQAEHPREHVPAQRRAEFQLAQIENHQNFRGYKARTESMMESPPPKRYAINNKTYANEMEKLRPKMTDKVSWSQRRNMAATHSASAPSLHLTAPAESLAEAARADARKEASQRKSESGHFAPWMSANTYGASLEATAEGREHARAQRHLSVNRLENHDFAITRKNNHFSSQDKLTRSDPYFMRPRMGTTNHSVKYDIVSNERKWFRY
eukprot:TRINITY_DN64528_c0_g1_i1.p1 TRINITY_DN64528_c0_g1~~TRINITY_DN64528_c0_g1_i1.p1  ORF type:complete len:306 (+),score=46.41 TRINITY_DN64528_c0_g1_i1:77-994(+)